MPVNEIDAIQFNEDLKETFLRYLYTTNMITEKEPSLRKAFWDKLDSEFKIISGPFVHCQPSYKPSLSLRELVNGLGSVKISEGLLRLQRKDFDPDRALYSHQVESIERIASGKSVVVATGTGSGKTESFLLPILDHILKQPGSGLRAILIYPMNALADDQLMRLRNLLSDLPEITFGRYTGDTDESVDENERNQYLANERVSRQEIRSDPPNLLITNFAMLEYLLLRPKDADLFKGHNLKFIVLDEAHTYSGAQGIEVSLLMRRLRQYLGISSPDLQFALTSATLGDDENALEKVAQFASHLSGVEFSTTDVLQGEHVDSFDDATDENPSSSQLLSIVENGPNFEEWENALDDPEMLVGLLRNAGFSPGSVNERKPSKILYDLFCRSRLFAQVHDLCRSKPSSLSEIGKEIGVENIEAIRWLVTIGAYARSSQREAPLLPARLHYFCRGLSGATVCVNTTCPSEKNHTGIGWSDLFLEDRANCEHCGRKVLPLLSCTHCGLPVIKIYLSADGTWRKQPELNEETEVCLLTWDLEPDEEWEEKDIPDDEEKYPTVSLCLACGRSKSGGRLEKDCCDKPTIRTFKRILDKEGNLPRCPSCGGAGGSYGTVLREFRTFEDAPTAVLSEIMMRNLPFDALDETLKNLPAHGRNLLAFSDSRQRAAFFAPYLGQTTAETAFMGPLENAIRIAEEKAGEPVSFEEVKNEYLGLIDTMNVVVLRKHDEGEDSYDVKPSRELSRANRRELGKEVEKTIYKNFCSSQKQKTTLIGMGIASLVFDFPAMFLEEVKARVPEIFVHGQKAGEDILSALLEIIVQRIAVQLPDHVVANRDIVSYGPPIYTFHRAESGRAGNYPNQRQRYRWNPYHGKRGIKRAIKDSRQVDLLCKVLKRDKFADEDFLKDLLDRIWDVFTDLLLSDDVSSGEYRVDPEYMLLTTNARWFSCPRCGLLTTRGELGVCPARDCKGQPVELGNEERYERFERNHYRQRYRQNPLPLVVKEHTAQLDPKIAKKYQKDFMDGRVNVLSSSTTFEMGIDVGDLKAVLLRNVPPITSSYIQRVGRAGRRKDGISLAVTYSRNLPHDQFHFNNPAAMIRGTVPAPYLNPRNRPLAQRHTNSLLLGYFLRGLKECDPDDLGRISVEGFFSSFMEKGEVLACYFASWAKTNRDQLERYIQDAFSGWQGIDIPQMIDKSVESMSCIKSKVDRTFAEFEKDIERFKDQYMEAQPRERNRINRFVDSLSRIWDQYKMRRLIDFLSKECWLPGYAFPQDTVMLLVRQANYSDRLRLERDREVGISEYAPGSEVIADGRAFKSAGLWFNSKEPEVWWYACCPQCRSIERRRVTEAPPKECSKCGCQFFGSYTSKTYLRPDAFTTSVEEEAKRPKLSRVRPPRTSEIFLLEGASHFEPHPLYSGVDVGKKENGLLMRVNRGYKFKSFNICMSCGANLDKAGPHTTPWGSACSGTTKTLDLAHEIQTDICQLRFSRCSVSPPLMLNENKAFWLSFTQAFLNGATDALGIAPNDIDGTYHGWRENDLKGEIVIYDRVPGGAGHINNILESLDRVLGAALQRVENCECGDVESSCYACLRGYSNQFDWPDLKRKPVIDWLSRWV